ncbi:MAG TPA: transcriptional repressor [Candidatus Acidoferrales bacterium]|nr:transcriptional repressor [Candidatus Acidoferrales bacterium]
MRAHREARVTAQAHTASQDRFAIFKEHLRRQGLKSTAQRDDIAHVFFASHRHISVEELYNEVKRINPRIGYATVYRTVKLLTECGLAVERHFRDGEARYESQAEGRHHDHLICERCGKIVEFEEDRIEALQAEVARRLGFRFTGHKMELYGLCRECQRARS